MGSSDSKVSVSSASPGITLPVAFNLYYKRSWGLKFRLGEHDSAIVYSAGLPLGWNGDLIVYGGPSSDDAPLAAVRWASARGDSAVTLPSPAPGVPQIVEELRNNSSMLHTSHQFTIAVSAGPFPQPQKFEWRQASSDELEPLGESSRGWKLMYGNEIVALWANASIGRHVSKTARFMFVNSGATGEFGQTWALMAVVTFLRLWQLQMQSLMTSAASGNAITSVV
ncbi:hypothetical protein S7711_08351 [Stachybotrys chartarum IBT 7711]|uniref:Uncharacterized protein n=1 Tax=Stachybotrys chartarum (strain CBS 109288 / IBT 7711) TaxID=1280523 RepID=A0A084AT69_STACB|nr:hypothetical protein S7711_08351 [Stachybotrys chartarum IBT 7711]